jgi:hypothetical protein
VLGDGAAAAGWLVLANGAPHGAQPVPGPDTPGRSAQLVVDRAGDDHAEVELLPGPAGREGLFVFDELLGGWPAPVDEAVAHDPVGVVPIHRHQVDPAAVPDRLAARRDHGGSVRVEHGRLEVGLDQDRGEPVHAGRPPDVPLEQGPGLVAGFSFQCPV